MKSSAFQANLDSSSFARLAGAGEASLLSSSDSSEWCEGVRSRLS